MQKVSVTHMSNTHNEWLRAMDFYKQELAILKARLTIIAGKNTDKEMAKQLDHYENQFKIQLENINKLQHDINQNLANTRTELQGNATAGYIDSKLLAEHNAFSNKYSAEEKVVNELRQNFNRFAAEWM